MEYEDYISLVLFCLGCNMKCSYCYNYDYIMDSSNVINESIESIIDNNITSITDALVFLGGEPTIYGQDLFEISKYVKDKYNLSVKLFTNGTNPQLVIDGMTLNYFDFVSIDFKSYFPSSAIQYKNNWNEYLWGMDSFFNDVVKNGFSNRIEVRMTVVPEIQHDSILIKSLCDDSGIKFVLQEDVSSSYKEINLLNF